MTVKLLLQFLVLDIFTDNLLESLNTDNQTAPPAPRNAWSEHSRLDSKNSSTGGKNTPQGKFDNYNNLEYFAIFICFSLDECVV